MTVALLSEKVTFSLIDYIFLIDSYIVPLRISGIIQHGVPGIFHFFFFVLFSLFECGAGIRFNKLPQHGKKEN